MERAEGLIEVVLKLKKEKKNKGKYRVNHAAK